jgi:hypothetical protein
MTLGKKSTICGNMVMIIPATIRVNQKGITPRKTWAGGTLVMDATISETTPTGGVSRPVRSMIMVITPNQTPLYPRERTMG